MRKCPSCGYPNPGNHKACFKCGVPLAVLPPPYRGPAWTCAACGYANPQHCPKCQQCGGTDPVPSPPKPAGSWSWGGAGFFGLMGCSFGIWFVLIGIVLCFTGIGALIGIPLIFCGILCPILSPFIGGWLGKGMK